MSASMVDVVGVEVAAAVPVGTVVAQKLIRESFIRVFLVMQFTCAITEDWKPRERGFRIALLALFPTVDIIIDRLYKQSRCNHRLLSTAIELVRL